MKDYSGYSAIVTGGASGLGKAAATRLTKAGLKVAIFDMNTEAGEEVAKALGGVFCQVDVTSDEAVVSAFDKARAAHGQERVLVNCAGKGSAMKTAWRDRKTGEIKRHDIEAFERNIQINLISTFRCISIAAAGMLALDPIDDGERGVIINTASIAGQEGQIGQVSYSAAKGGIAGMTLTIARDLSGDGIRINTIMPGIFSTPPVNRLPEKVLENLRSSALFPKRLGDPEEYGDLVDTIVRNSYFNGQVLRLDAGARMPAR